MTSPKATYYSQYALSKFVLENVDANAKRIAILFDKTELKLSKYGGMIYPSLIIVDQMKYSNNNFAVFSDTEKVGINVKESQLTKKGGDRFRLLCCARNLRALGLKSSMISTDRRISSSSDRHLIGKI